MGDESNTRSEREHPRWEEMWQEGISPGDKFDIYEPLPALKQMVKEGTVPTGRALVPGCGRGYDVLLLATSDRVAIGVDLSNTAIQAAKEYYQSVPDDKKPPHESVVFKQASFFDLPEDPPNQFQFIYDYTFFCALDPSVRGDWAKKMAALVAPGGELCTIMYPIGDKEGGPPFKVTMEDYASLLEPLGFQHFQLEMLPPELSHEGRDGTTINAWGLKLSTAIGRWRKN
mmetsp:Transcript_20314/g.29163  ORF Transcript_20314/g.29163 Transcript_20314/m.29163 type:complete len:229 (+) Transcript_20314:73-759(+)